MESSVVSNYDVPLLNVPSFSDKAKKEVKIKFTENYPALKEKRISNARKVYQRSRCTLTI